MCCEGIKRSVFEKKMFDFPIPFPSHFSFCLLLCSLTSLISHPLAYLMHHFQMDGGLAIFIYNGLDPFPTEINGKTFIGINGDRNRPQMCSPELILWKLGLSEVNLESRT